MKPVRAIYAVMHRLSISKTEVALTGFFVCLKEQKMLTKICTKCGVEKDVSEYSKWKLGKYDVRGDCKTCQKQYKAQHYQATKDSKLEKAKVYYKANKKILVEKANAYYESNRESILKKRSAYVKANRHLHNANSAKRRAAKLQATPSWSNKEHIDSIYLLAAINREGGHDLHVDHIVPLISDIVCGLHCEANLQLMPASDNISKGNRHWPDMP